MTKLNQEQETYCGFIAIVGRPNVGKSTLLNKILGQKISITSRKAQTTRHRIVGIKTEGIYQEIYVDTPGLHIEEKRAINRLMNRAASSAIGDVDLIIFVVDGTHWNADDEMVLNNNINCLPDEVREKFEIHDCYVQVPLTEEKINDLKEDIINTVEEINSKEREYKNSEDENIFWQEVTDADEFRLATLSGYSRSLHKPYDQYLKEKELFKEETESDSDADEDDLLAFVNSL